MGLDDVDEAGDGAAALERLRAEPADIVITDIEMPTMNGFEPLSAIKKDERLKHVPVPDAGRRGTQGRHRPLHPGRRRGLPGQAVHAAKRSKKSCASRRADGVRADLTQQGWRPAGRRVAQARPRPSRTATAGRRHRASFRQQHLVDDVDHAVRLDHVGDRDVAMPPDLVGRRMIMRAALGRR